MSGRVEKMKRSRGGQMRSGVGDQEGKDLSKRKLDEFECRE